MANILILYLTLKTVNIYKHCLLWALSPQGSYLFGDNMKFQASTLFLIFGLLYGCTADNVLTKKEMQLQSEADAIVANTLFEHDLNEQASYNVSKTGAVTIKFTESVKSKDYTKIVDLLRSNAAIDSVLAEQSGAEVCGL